MIVEYFVTFYPQNVDDEHSPTKELVNGSNCEIAADRLCDTPADPMLNGKCNNNCVYTRTDRDPQGHLYNNPDTHNYMSYALDCRTHFSTGQKNIVRVEATTSRKTVFENNTRLSNVTISTNRNSNYNNLLIINSVTINNSAHVVLDACSTVIEKDFEVKLGCTLEIR